MKKKICFLVLAAGLVLFGGCTTKEADSTASSAPKETISSSQETEKRATITLLDGEKELSKKVVTFNKGEKLFDVLKDNYAIEDNDGMITSIDGQAQDDKNNKYWVFTINDEQVNSGAKDVVLQEGDRVVFKLEQF